MAMNKNECSKLVLDPNNFFASKYNPPYTDIDNRIQEIQQEKHQKALVREATIRMIRESIPVVSELLKRQTEIKQLLEFSLKMDTYSNGLFDLLNESKVVAAKLAEYELLIEELTTIKLGY